MAVRKIYHVTYWQTEDRWHVTEIKRRRNAILRRSKTKAAAIRYAVSLAKSRRHIGQVVIHTADGKIEHEFTYGVDSKAKG